MYECQVSNKFDSVLVLNHSVLWLIELIFGPLRKSTAFRGTFELKGKGFWYIQK